MCDAVVKNPPTNARDTRDADSIPELIRFPGIGNGIPFQDSCLGNLMDKESDTTEHACIRVEESLLSLYLSTKRPTIEMDASTHIQAKIFSITPLQSCLQSVSCLHLAWQRNDRLLWVAFSNNYALRRPHFSDLPGTLLSRTSSTVVILNYNFTPQTPEVLLKSIDAHSPSQTHETRISGSRSLDIWIS